MKIIETSLSGVIVFEPKVMGDQRGFFVETFRDSWLKELGINTEFVQDNHSRSSKGVLRGLHFQKVNPQGKLVRVSRGRVFDVAVDIRPESPTYRNWVGVELDDVAHRQLWIPPGLAHGFCVLSEVADFTYKCTSYFDPASDSGIYWNDPKLGIMWPKITGTDGYILSEKDRNLPRFTDFSKSNSELL